MDHWTMDYGPWTKDGPWTVDRGPWTLQHAPRSMDHGPWTLLIQAYSCFCFACLCLFDVHDCSFAVYAWLFVKPLCFWLSSLKQREIIYEKRSSYLAMEKLYWTWDDQFERAATVLIQSVWKLIVVHDHENGLCISPFKILCLWVHWGSCDVQTYSKMEPLFSTPHELCFAIIWRYRLPIALVLRVIHMQCCRTGKVWSLSIASLWVWWCFGSLMLAISKWIVRVL